MKKQLLSPILFFLGFSISLYIFAFLSQRAPDWLPGWVTKLSDFIDNELLARAILGSVILFPLLCITNILYVMGVSQGMRAALPFAFILLIALIIQSVMFPIGDLVLGKGITWGTIITAVGMILAGVIGYLVDSKFSV